MRQLMRLVLFLVALIVLASDYVAHGPYSLAYLMYAVFTDVRHAVAWHFYKI